MVSAPGGGVSRRRRLWPFSRRRVPGSVFADSLPGTPTGLTVKEDGRNAVDLSWTAPTDGGPVDGYRIDRSTDGHTWHSHKGATMGTLIQGTSDKDVMLKAGTDYIYRVFAVNSHGVGPTSDDAGATTDPIEAPGSVREPSGFGWQLSNKDRFDLAATRGQRWKGDHGLLRQYQGPLRRFMAHLSL